ncbi:MAG: GNAT family N-acetyltransferase [Gammaproteobacteria bacterium]|nr:GNAT family N-acetyltransferase [Gammaproteobacteria bacterium]MBU1442082.1 GNAT family N-acetyltransferase [Gammaproteobacteria bacterium]MBU2285316.1 GNAT family N-acetyltransferase [Gammaproteobacteria bacterium]MBU2408329.1 GNAT family N-acetyltransferase [Gammaproteobacteria bacterium]
MGYSVSRPLPLSDTPAVFLTTPDDPQSLEATRAIFSRYAESLGIDLSFQNFEGELAELPGEYDEPRGALLIALVLAAQDLTQLPNAPPMLQRTPESPVHHVAGCCALRPLDSADYPNAAEMKRLYVHPAFRGLGLGRQLAEAILDAARGAGYACVLLDTLDDMESARALYEDLGFTEVPPYYHNPIAGSHYLKVDL